MRRVDFWRDVLAERFDDTTRRLGFVVRTVEAEGRALRRAFEYGKEAERNFGHLPRRADAPGKDISAVRITSTGKRLSRVV